MQTVKKGEIKYRQSENKATNSERAVKCKIVRQFNIHIIVALPIHRHIHHTYIHTHIEYPYPYSTVS